MPRAFQVDHPHTAAIAPYHHSSGRGEPRMGTAGTGIVDPLFMRAVYDSIGHNDRLGTVITHKLENLACNNRICPNVALQRLGATRQIFGMA
jgi:hypothetical protein